MLIVGGPVPLDFRRNVAEDEPDAVVIRWVEEEQAQALDAALEIHRDIVHGDADDRFHCSSIPKISKSRCFSCLLCPAAVL